jgi:type III secretion protein L
MNAFLPGKKVSLDTLPQTKLLKAKDYLAYCNAQEIIRVAEAKAQAMVRGAEEIYATEKERGYEDGVQASKARLSEQITETAKKAADYLESIEKDLVTIIMNAIRKIMGEFDDEILTGKVVNNALYLFQNQHRLTLRVAPSLKRVLEKKRDTFFQAIPYLDIVSDPQLAPGDCVLESEIGVVDASIETQLKAMESALKSRTQAN